jgi:hypothetical protein
MTNRLLSHSGCNDGSCPTFLVDDVTGNVTVRGYDPADPTQTAEIDVVIPPARWAALMANLPNAGR